MSATAQKIPDLFSPQEEWKEAKVAPTPPQPVELPAGVAIYAECRDELFPLRMYPIFASPGKRRLNPSGGQTHGLVCEVSGGVGLGAKVIVECDTGEALNSAGGWIGVLTQSGYTNVESRVKKRNKGST